MNEVMNSANIYNLEEKVTKLDKSMAKMAASLTEFMTVQAKHDERSLHILEQIKVQREEVNSLRNIVTTLLKSTTENKLTIALIVKVMTLVATSGAIGGVITKLFL